MTVISPYLSRSQAYLISVLLTAKTLHLLEQVINKETMLKFMKNKILIPLIVILAIGAFFSFRYVTGDITESRKQIIIKTIAGALEEGHFAPRDINDSFSARVYQRFINRMDYDKRFLTQEDIQVLSQYKYKLDDEIKNGSTDFYDKFSELYNQGIDESEKYYQSILEEPFDFNVNEEYIAGHDDLEFPKNASDRQDRWRKYLKYRVLSTYVDMKQKQEKRVADNDTTLKDVKTNSELEAEARTKVRESMDYFYKRMKKIDAEDRFTLFVNSITMAHDPHTDYFPPEDKERFDEAMSGSFFGIGARLQDKEGRITVVEIIAGSPCWKQGELEAGDEIIKVAQGKEEPVDVTDYDIDDAVKIIRGPKGTEVRLTVKKVNGAEEVIPIIRDEVQIEEAFARSAIIESKVGPVGYIYLPDFYADFRDANGRRSAEDVAIEVTKLKNAGVKGIILDLRYNGGGSLNDVINMTGLFIDEGPIVQVKSSRAAPVKLDDRQSGTLYDGPLAVMVNHGSASASEIMAAALQDYKRAVVVGSTTFGKGTVQKIISLDDYLRFSDKLSVKDKKKDIGALKLTIQKFYRVNGGSTQLKGVTPDILFPDQYEHIDMGERKDKSALEWDEIPAADYKIVGNPVNVRELAKKSYERMNNNETFQLIKQNADRIKTQEEDDTYSLNEEMFAKELKEANETSERMKELDKEAVRLTIVNPKEDLPKVNLDSNTIAKNEEWLKNLSKDIYLSETLNIIEDMNSMNTHLNMGMRSK